MSCLVTCSLYPGQKTMDLLSTRRSSSGRFPFSRWRRSSIAFVGWRMDLAVLGRTHGTVPQTTSGRSTNGMYDLSGRRYLCPTRKFFSRVLCWMSIVWNAIFTSVVPFFLAQGWWHSVINLDDVNIAITHNYLSPSNLGNALKFFVEKQDHISGCRDRQESIKPEHIYSVLVEKLQENEPRHLEKALAQKEWTCRAWTNMPVGDRNRNNDGGVVSEDDDSKVKAQNSSIMEKTERVKSFSFSFL